MEKITINGKEVEICGRTEMPLTDEELEGIHGGSQSKTFYRWFCRVQDCGYRSQWYEDSGECWLDLEAHYDATKHYTYEAHYKIPPCY